MMVLSLAMLLMIFQSPGPSLDSLVSGVERSFATMKYCSADFVQIFQDPLNQKQQESGHLYLMRPRMMRWEYKKPEEKLFVSDSKNVYLYVPADRQVSK